MFNLSKILASRARHTESIKQAEFYHFLINDIAERLTPLDKDYANALLIDIDSELSLPLLQEGLEKLGIVPKITSWSYVDIVKDRWPNQQFDLIVLPCLLQWVGEVQQFLTVLRKILRADGILIGNFVGDKSLRTLRKLLLQLESRYDQPHTPHISPFIQFEHISPLLSQTGFTEIVTDMEQISLKYSSPLELMRAIQILGQSNALTLSSGYTITQKMYRALNDYQASDFIDHLYMITFVASSKGSIRLKKEHFAPTG